MEGEKTPLPVRQRLIIWIKVILIAAFHLALILAYGGIMLYMHDILPMEDPATRMTFAVVSVMSGIFPIGIIWSMTSMLDRLDHKEVVD